MLSVNLQPLTRDETDALARELLSDADPAEATLLELYDRSGGNPLFLIELVALTEAGGGADLPDTLRTLIAARLDQLTLAQRQLLENAAARGRQLADGLRRMSNKHPLIGDVRGRGLVIGVAILGLDGLKRYGFKT